MGLGLFWKPAGPTSSYFLADVKKELGLAGPARKGIGHSGTLDPFAEGWLLVGWDEGTKLLAGLTDLNKTYVAEMILGLSSESFDVEGPGIEVVKIKETLTEDDCRDLLARSIKKFSQIPPRFSAKKIGGQVAYDLARKGETFELKPVTVEIVNAQHLSLRSENISEINGHALSREARVWVWTFSVTVSSGTYIRALARDWGRELCGEPSLLGSLTRTGIGSYQSETPAVGETLPAKILKKSQALELFFKPWPEEQKEVYIDELQSQLTGAVPTDGGPALLLSDTGSPVAVWAREAHRWRYFNSDPFAASADSNAESTDSSAEAQNSFVESKG